MMDLTIDCPHCDGLVELGMEDEDSDSILCYNCGNYFSIQDTMKIPHNIIDDETPEYDGDYPIDDIE